MATVTIRNVPDHVRDVFATRAAKEGRSMQEYLRRTLLEIAERKTQQEILDEARENARLCPPMDMDQVLADIAADRR